MNHYYGRICLIQSDTISRFLWLECLRPFCVAWSEWRMIITPWIRPRIFNFPPKWIEHHLRSAAIAADWDALITAVFIIITITIILLLYGMMNLYISVYILFSIALCDEIIVSISPYSQQGQKPILVLSYVPLFAVYLFWFGSFCTYST